MATGSLTDIRAHVVDIVDTSKMTLEVSLVCGVIVATALAIVTHCCLIGGDDDRLGKGILMVSRKGLMVSRKGLMT